MRPMILPAFRCFYSMRPAPAIVNDADRLYECLANR
jgi:hypothetical protein